MNIKVLTAGIIVATLFFAAASAYTNSVTDPVIKTGDGSSPAAGITAPDFTIFSQTGTSPSTSPCNLGATVVTSCVFENEIVQSGVEMTITSLVLDAPGTVTCGFLAGSPFAVCAVDVLAGGGTQVTFNVGSIPFDGAFSLDFEGFGANSIFSVAASTSTVVPEPGTMLLFGTGLLGIVGLKRRKAPKL